MLPAEYIWIDPKGNIRSKTKILKNHSLTKEGLNPPEIPMWTFDGSSTEQATSTDSECILNPVCVMRNPLEGGIVALCEIFDHEGNPHPDNYRFHLRHALKEKMDETQPMMGMEQEYTLFQKGKPYGWRTDGIEMEEQGKYYCGVGAGNTFGRNLVLDHMKVCVSAGLLYEGYNAEVMPSQWEFQIGAADPITVSDHLWIARYFLLRLAEMRDITVSFDAKPLAGDWNGAGLHTNFSTQKMRGEKGLEHIKKACEDLAKTHSENLKEYGTGTEERLTGKHETCSYKDFKWGVGDRTASIRIPVMVANEGKGYFEDRRPNANANPYRVATAISRSVL